MRGLFLGFFLCLIIVGGMLLDASAKKADVAERSRMAASIAEYIADGDYGRSIGRPNPFRSTDVKLGTAVVVWPWALADWRAARGLIHGQVSFFYLCDHWNVGIVETRPIQSRELVTLTFPKPMTARTAAELTTELAAAEASPTAYVKAPGRGGC